MFDSKIFISCAITIVELFVNNVCGVRSREFRKSVHPKYHPGRRLFHHPAKRSTGLCCTKLVDRDQSSLAQSQLLTFDSSLASNFINRRFPLADRSATSKATSDSKFFQKKRFVNNFASFIPLENHSTSN